MGWKLIALVTVVLIIVVLAYIVSSRQPSSTITMVDPLDKISTSYTTSHESVPVTIDAERGPMNHDQSLVNPPPTLDNSDQQVQLAIDDLNPALLNWLMPREQIRKWVLTIDLIASGKMPERYLPINYAVPAFKVIEQGDTLTADPSNYQRITPLLKQITTIEPRQFANYYHLWRSVFNTAYHELGKTGTFDQRLLMAIDQVLAVQPLNQGAALEQPGVFYQYVDPNLQKASAVSHFMWRIGPENTLLLQQYLQRLKYHLLANNG